MDEELKTLKDLTVHNGWEDYGDSSPMGFLGDIVELDELKAEAIKWVKHWRELDEAKCRICNIPTDTDFMHFFNITEEDLK